MSYDISINISASGAESVEREFKKIENAYKNLQSMGMNFSQASGIKNLAADINTLATSITNFTTKISNAVTQMNSLAAAIKGAAANAQALSSAFSTTGMAGGGGGGGSSSSSRAKTKLGFYEAAIKDQEAKTVSSIVRSLSAIQRGNDALARARLEGVDKNNPEALKLYDYKQRLAQAKQERILGQYTSGLDPRMTGEGLHTDAINSLVEAQRHKFSKFLASSPANIHAAESIFASGLDPATLAQYKQFLAIEGNKPSTMWSRMKNNVAASPLGMASLFMLRYRIMSGLLAGAGMAGSTMMGGGREDMIGPNFALGSVGFNAPMRAGMEGRAIELSKTIPGLTIPKYFDAAAQVASALDVKERGVGNIAAGTRASLMFGSLSNLGPEESGKLLSKTYAAMEGTSEFKGMQSGQAMEKIAALMTGAISVSGAWGPDIMKSFAHFLPMGIKSGMSLQEMLAFNSTLITQGFHPGTSGRYGKWLTGDKGMEMMGKAMVFGDGEAGEDYYDTRTHAAMKALKARGIKPGTAKQLNKDVAREMGAVMAEKFAEDPLGTLALLGEKTKSAMAKGFTFKDLGASQDFLAALTKTFVGGGGADMQEMNRRIGEEGTISGMEDKYGEAVRNEIGAAWKMLKTSMENMADAFSKTSPLYNAIDGLAKFMADVGARWSRESALSLGGTINPETGMPFKDKAEGMKFGVNMEAVKGANSWKDTMNWLGLSPTEDDVHTRMGVEKEYYDKGWHNSMLPKFPVTAFLHYKQMAQRGISSIQSWWSSYKKGKAEAGLKTPEELEKMRLSGDPAYESALHRDKTARANLEAYAYEEAELQKQQDPFLARNGRFSGADMSLLRSGGYDSRLSPSASGWWRSNWKKTLGVKDVSELMNPRYWGVDKFDRDNPPPLINYGWGINQETDVGYGTDSAQPVMSDIISRQGRLDTSSFNSSLAELTSAIQKAAGAINKAAGEINPKSISSPGAGNGGVNTTIGQQHSISK